jgi:hypothetical protein
MGLGEDPSTQSQNQATEKNPQRVRRARHPRSRICLLKGCGRSFRPEHPLTRYCGEQCREQAQQWREWKARHRYRQSDGGKQKRQAQSRRYRLRKDRKKQKTATANGARVIPTKFFFVLLRSAWMLRGVPAQPKVAAATVLLPDVSPCPGTGSGAGEALARPAACPAMKTHRYSPDILRNSYSLDSVSLPTRRGRGSGASRNWPALFSLLLHVVGSEGRKR